MKILACQIRIPPMTDAGDKAAHVERVLAAISRRLAERRADLVVLPELSTIDYSQVAFARLDQLSEGLDGPSFAAFSRLAERHGVFVSFGMARSEDGAHYIAQVTVGPDGRCLGHYDKLHLAQFAVAEEKGWFTPGDHLHVFEVGGVRVAPVICYDFRFPELTRRLCVEHGVETILHPVAFARDGAFASWHRFAVCRAMENQVYLLSLNRAGPGFGASLWCPPGIDSEHRETVFPDAECFRYLDVEPDLIARLRREYPFRGDRRDDYRELPVLEAENGG